MFKKMSLLVATVIGLLFTFGSEDSYKTTVGADSGGQTVTLATVNWESEIASTNVLAQVLKEAGFNVQITTVDPAIMFSSVAEGQLDAMVGGWVPTTHQAYAEEYGDSMVDLGANLEGAISALTVPTYMEDINSITDLTDENDSTITAIEPGAGVTNSAQNAVKEYDNLSDWEVSVSSTGAMIAELDQAINNEEDIVVVGWKPHWMFMDYDLKMLDDPENVFGGYEEIHSYAREGLKEDNPEAYKIIDNFYWEVEDMSSVMEELATDVEPEEAADNWIEANRETVDGWLE
ncbi:MULTISPECIES: glycine betaine ABC transporter substrate-binding protein [Lactobacillaceae]|uniref:L-proline glycine betaine ABC transport system permease protein ProW n=1 Tax=Weissella jogaejeotgali TaxID=1631871 RepID=A0A1L6RBH2_9LACO|nr:MULTISPECIES: glycine betaine ABC transporter substrate-binding protein [Weissella]APS41917.1 L-proline glycine betaine ABC transport system permease protein ProW [Weissella jogaejeotgali]QDJ58893.1 glycine betaine ABC transporter substrate-binding protein [Weissella hellenica]QEA57881.1 glycine betaine ABC transporter substrate-binding protein [Weissella hellenica]